MGDERQRQRHTSHICQKNQKRFILEGGKRQGFWHHKQATCRRDPDITGAWTRLQQVSVRSPRPHT